MREDERPKPSNVIEALARVMEEMPAVGKDRQTDEGPKYKYRSIEDITAAAQKLLAKFCVVPVPRVTARQVSTVTTTRGSTMTLDQQEFVYRFYGPGGREDYIEVGPVWGIGWDPGDKASKKAATMAYTIVLQQVFVVGDSRDDAETGQHELGHSAPPDPDEEYRSLGWSGRSQHDAWRQDARARTKALPTDEARAQLKEWAADHGLDRTKPVPYGLADAFMAALEEVEEGGSEAAAEDPGRPFGEEEG